MSNFDIGLPPDPPPCPNCGGMLSGTPTRLKCVPPPADYEHDPDIKPGGCGWSGTEDEANLPNWESYEANASAARRAPSGRQFEARYPGRHEDIELNPKFRNVTADEAFNDKGLRRQYFDRAYEWVGENHPELDGEEFERKVNDVARELFQNDQAYSGGPPCDHCGSENTQQHEPVPSMMGYGSDESWTCNDCGKTSFSTPLGEGRLSLKTLILNENAPDQDPITGEQEDVCPVCGTDHQDPNTTCDYEECGHCGFDHDYEYEDAKEWHVGHDPTNSLYESVITEAKKPVLVNCYATLNPTKFVADTSGVDDSNLRKQAFDLIQSQLRRVEHSEKRTDAVFTASNFNFPADDIELVVNMAEEAFAKVLEGPYKTFWGSGDQNQGDFGFQITGTKMKNKKPTQEEGASFDKFMDKILIQESVGVKRVKQPDSPLRLRAARHQDRPANKTVIGRRK